MSSYTVLGFRRRCTNNCKAAIRGKCVIIIINEMHLREDFAYDKHTGNVKYTHSYTISYVFMYMPGCT